MKQIKEKIITTLFIFILILSSTASIIYAETDSADTSLVSGSAEYESETEEESEETTEELEILSEAVTLIDSSTGEIIYSKNGDQQMYPASTTKVMTAILVLENGNLDDIVTASATAINLIPSGYSSSYISEGEEMSVQNLLEALLLHSSNDVANILAEYISGSIDDFVNLMNEKATELGCTNTHFVNTNGVHDEDHYSTANDLAIIARYCMQNSTFRTMVATTRYTIPATNKYSEERTYVNTNDMLISTSEYYREDCIGIKTGYTSQAKNCLICASQKDDMEVIAVILKSANLDARYSDANALFDYGYEYLEQKQVELNLAQLEAEAIAAEASTSTQSSENNSFQYFIGNNVFIITLISALLLIILIIILIKKTRK